MSLNINQVYNALILGIKDYFEKMDFKKAIIGSSGGIDSAVTLALIVPLHWHWHVRHWAAKMLLLF